MVSVSPKFGIGERVTTKTGNNALVTHWYIVTKITYSGRNNGLTYTIQCGNTEASHRAIMLVRDGRKPHQKTLDFLIDIEFNIEDEVYLKSDPDQSRYMVTGICYYGEGEGFTVRVESGGKMHWVFPYEITFLRNYSFTN